MEILKRTGPGVLVLLLTAAVLVGCSAEARKSRLLKSADTYFESGEYDKAKVEYLKVLKEDPKNATAIRRLGTICLEQGSPLQAAPFLLAARQMFPENVDARAKLVLVFLYARQFEEARKEALAILEQSPAHDEAMLVLVEASRSPQQLEEAEQRLRSINASDDPGFHLAWAGLSLRKQDFAAATSAVKQALSLDPRSIEAHVAMAKLYWRTNDLSGAEQEFKAATELAPARSLARLAYAEFKARTGAPDHAKLQLSEVTREAPDFLPAWRILAQIALTEKRFDESLTYIENILFRDPANVEAYLLQAQIWLAKRETNRAIESLERLNKVYQDLPVIKVHLARAYLQNNNAPQAANVLSQVTAANSDNAEAALLLAEANLRSGKAQQVVASMLELRKKQPDLVPAQVLLAKAYQAFGRLDDAAAVFREQIKLSPENPQPHLLLGLTLRQQKKIEEARQALEKARQLAPENFLIATQLIDLDIADGRFDAALQRVQTELERAPQSPGAHFLEGKVYAAQGQWDRAEASLLKTLELDANYSSAYHLLISSYVASNKLPQAINQVEKLLSKSPDNPRALLISALLYERTNEPTKARTAYEKLLSAKPDFPPVLNNLAYLYAERLGELDKAYELAQKARVLQPADANIADTLGWILYKRGDYKQALGLLQESAQNLPNNPEIQFHLGMANYMMGRTAEARTAFSQAAAAPTGFPGKDEANRRLSLLGDSEDKGTQLSRNEQSDDPLAEVRLGDSYEGQGAFAQAAAAYEKAIKVNPNQLSAATKLARLYAGPLKDSEKALKYASKARELAPNDPKIVALLGSAAYHADNFTWAYSLLQEPARRLSDDPQILYNFAWAAYSLGKVGEARQAMQRLLASAPNSSQASHAKLFVAMTPLDQEGTDLVATESEVEETLKANPGYVPALMVQAAVFLQRGESEAAAATYAELLRRFPDFAPAQKRLASLYATDPEKRGQAYNLVMKARKILPDDPELAQMLAELSYERKEYAYALQLLEESARKKPLDAEALYYLGMSHWRVKEHTKSEEALQRALAAGLPEPLSSDAKRVLTELRQE
jgi:tetratricopeptide (TPR) repeat protein